ncbi:hypothetical protein [Amycolatopsis dendrobii]|uniref:Uncharacterized protein n=1 Tax=Amycolatopsis dendrobii TaxID=2760662 RepID=A0A7W3VW74_9PSEU|nr:hypothetical protein [Amycolatopsis dendrobii]MBB1154359.1 hypothetical protein [Amycolatopsis dendrobii]
MDSITTLASCLASALAALSALALRLRWQADWERRRQETLDAITARLPPDGAIELDELRSDGSRIKMRIVARQTAAADNHA